MYVCLISSLRPCPVSLRLLCDMYEPLIAGPRTPNPLTNHPAPRSNPAHPHDPMLPLASVLLGHVPHLGPPPLLLLPLPRPLEEPLLGPVGLVSLSVRRVQVLFLRLPGRLAPVASAVAAGLAEGVLELAEPQVAHPGAATLHRSMRVRA